MSSFVRTLAVAGVVVALGACGGNPEPPPPPAAAPAPSARPTTTSTTSNDAAARAAEAERQRREAELTSIRSTLAEMVFFAYDRSDISPDARAVLDRKARILREQPRVSLRVEGHADERGSTEYNLALGNRRAESVRTYLANVGINASRLQSTTYGESRPMMRGTDESAWSRNRRAEFVVTAGLGQ
jgi:peptidoglycan-associated lipoprotein